VIPETSGQILGNMAVYQPNLANANFGVGLAEGTFALAEGLDLSTHEYQSSFDTIQEMVVVGGGAILRNNLYAFVLRLLGVGFHVRAIIAAARKTPQVTDFDGFPGIGVTLYETFIEMCPVIQYFIRLTQLRGFVAASQSGVLNSIGISKPSGRLTFASYRIFVRFGGGCAIAGRLSQRE
jgi:hypothetical protein